MKIALLHTGIRGDEKMLIEAARGRKLQLDLIDARTLLLNPYRREFDYEVILERCISTVKGTHAIRYFQELKMNIINKLEVAEICEDKFATSLRLGVKDVPAAKAMLCFDYRSALDVIELLKGFPVVLKPVTGSWGRMIAKVTDEHSLEALIDHKQTLGDPTHGAFYIQEYIDKKKDGLEHDIRAFVIGDECICAIYRNSEHWITNTARGGKATNCPVTKELAALCKKASRAIGGGILAMDVFETKKGLIINEINHTMEFKNSEAPTGVSISNAILDYCLSTV